MDIGTTRGEIDHVASDATKTARELYDKMLELYPDRANPGFPLEFCRCCQG
jgi:hypothetical protein